MMIQAAPMVGEIEAFLYRVARLIDGERFDDWLSCFKEGGTYYVNSRDNAERIPVGGTIDDVVAIITGPPGVMHLRVDLIRDLWHAAETRSRTLHVVSNVEVEESSSDGVLARSALLLHVTRPGQAPQILAGRQEHLLVRTDAGWRIAAQKVLLEDDAITGPLLVIV